MTHPLLDAIERRRCEIGMNKTAAAQASGLEYKTVISITKTRRPGFYAVETLANTVGLRLVTEPIDEEPIRFVRRRK